MSHPFVEQAIRSLDSELGLAESDAAELERALADYFGHPDLEQVVRELMAFALYMGEALGAVATALRLLDVACSATVALECRAHRARKISRTRQRLLDLRPDDRRAPVHDAPAPADSRSVGAYLALARRVLR